MAQPTSIEEGKGKSGTNYKQRRKREEWRHSIGASARTSQHHNQVEAVDAVHTGMRCILSVLPRTSGGWTVVQAHSYTHAYTYPVVLTFQG